MNRWLNGMYGGFGLAIWFAVSPAILAAPLTLDAVLAHANSAHPVLELARAQGELAQAEAQLAQSLNDFRVNLDASLRSGRNPVFNDQFSPDHLIKLNARKTLLDFGRQQAGTAAAEEEREAQVLLLQDTRAQRRLSLMARYFDVLLADMRDAAETEAMAVAYVNWDNAKERLALGQLAQWQVAEQESRFLESLARRDDVRRGLREKRMALGAAMNMPGMLQDDLADPKLPDNERALSTFDDLLTQLQTGNPRLAAQKRLLAGASQRLNSVRADNRPSIEFEAEAAAWSRDSTTRDELRAGFNLVWPLWQGGRDGARLSREQARFHALQAQHDQLLMELRQSLLEAREEIHYLRGVGRRNAELNADFREQALDKARAEYEMELKTNLGSSMAETQFAHLRRRGVEYRLALAWARLDALLGVAHADAHSDVNTGAVKQTTQTTLNMESK
jgi:outer membrane protein TolC